MPTRAAQDGEKRATMQGTPVAGGQGYGSATSNSHGVDYRPGISMRVQESKSKGPALGKPYSMHYQVDCITKYRLDQSKRKITPPGVNSIPEFADD